MNENKGNTSLFYLKYELLLWLLPLLSVTFIAFFPALKNGFTNFDDPVYVLENPYVYALTWENLRHIFTEFYYGGYYPLSILSFAINNTLGGMDAYGFHLTNILLHLINTTLVFYLIHRLFGILSITVITALLFGIHPLHVESVAWISARKDVLYAFFFFLSLLYYVHFLDTKKHKFYIIALFLFLFSVISKTMAVSLVPCLFLIDWIRERKLLEKKSIIEKIPFFVIALVFGVINIISQKSIGAIHAETTLPLIHRLVFAFYAFCMYVYKLAVPTSLSAFYPYPIKAGESLPFTYWLFSIPIVLIAYTFFRFFKKYILLSFAFLFFVFNIVLVLQILQINDFVMADRFVYVASAGFFIFIALLIDKALAFFDKYRKEILIAFSVYCLFLLYQTNTYTKVWNNSISLWDNVLDKYPDVYRALDKRGQAKSEEGRFHEAMVDFDRAISLNPDYYSVYINRGFALNMMGKNEDALADYDKAISIYPDYYMGYNNRGTTKANMGDLKGAINDFTNTIVLNPNHVKAYTNRGLAYMNLEMTDSALHDFNKAIDMDPDYYFTFNFRSLVLARMNKLTDAIKDLDHCLKINPNYPDALYNRGVLRLQLNQKHAACTDLNRAATLGHERAGPMLKLYCN